MKTAYLLLITFTICTVALAQSNKQIESQLVILNINTGEENIILHEKRHFEAPNWSRDGKYLIINSNGLLEKISLKGEKIGTIDTKFANNCNNDHGISFDGKWIIISNNNPSIQAPGGSSQIYILPIDGGEPRLITKNYPSYWHGMSPNNEWIVYCALRNNEWDVYKANIITGEETRLTHADGLDDGPEYSYDGEWIYFNSHRTGRMHIYRMRPNGSEQTQMTFDNYDNWFPHPSPNNKSVVYISYIENQNGDHPFGKDVLIRQLDVETGKTKNLTRVFYGGQGTLNVHSWSPDGEHIAYVKYINNNN
ncbi:MAG: TolB family protein [Proteiniphilum sp.]|nr:TolB family protein [Proteiniphilum sp.]